MGGCRFPVGLRRLLQGGLQGSAYQSIPANDCKYSAGLLGYSTGDCRALWVLCGGPQVLKGTYEWLQVYSAGLRGYYGGAPRGFSGTPHMSAGLHRYSTGIRGDQRVLTGTCGWLQALRRAPWVLRGLLGAPQLDTPSVVHD